MIIRCNRLTIWLITAFVLLLLFQDLLLSCFEAFLRVEAFQWRFHSHWTLNIIMVLLLNLSESSSTWWFMFNDFNLMLLYVFRLFLTLSSWLFTTPCSLITLSAISNIAFNLLMFIQYLMLLPNESSDFMT